MSEKAQARLLNTTQFCRAADIAIATLHRKMAAGQIKPDAMDGKGRMLFDADKVERIKALVRSGAEAATTIAAS